MQRAFATLSFILLTVANANYLPAHLTALRQSEHHQIIQGILPKNSLSHFCIVTGWNEIDALLARFALMLGVDPPQTGISGGLSSNGTYMNPEHNGTAERLQGSNRIAFLHDVNNDTYIEFLGADDKASWWSYLYAKKGMEVHHMGYELPPGEQIWPVVEAFAKAGLGKPVQWAHFGDGCYVYMDSQDTLGVTVEILQRKAGGGCPYVPAPPNNN